MFEISRIDYPELLGLDILKLLLDSGMPADDYIRCYKEKGGYEIIKPINESIVGTKITYISLLLQRGASPISEQHFGRTPLYFAVHNPCAPIVKMFLQKGAHSQINKITCFGETALHIACRNNTIKLDVHFEEIIPLLLEYGADLNIKNESNQNPLTVANAQTIEIVIKKLAELTFERQFEFYTRFCRNN